MQKKLIKPKALLKGSTIGIFTPSFPAHTQWREKYLYGIQYLNSLGFKVIEGSITKKAVDEGYRSGTPQERASEFMELIENKNISCLLATVGGNNSSSLIPYLNFKVIQENPKIICGLSDITSLHCAILKYSGLITYYGPHLMQFTDYPNPDPYSMDSFVDALTNNSNIRREIKPPKKWSNHLRDARNSDWKNIPREYKINLGWKALKAGKVTAPLLCMNLNTLLSAAGTNYFPDVENKILLLEEMDAPFGRTESSFRQLDLMGIFDKIKGMIFGKIEFPDESVKENSAIYEKIILETVGNRNFPIVTNFDCAHTIPMITIAQETIVTLEAHSENNVNFYIEECMVS